MLDCPSCSHEPEPTASSQTASSQSDPKPAKRQYTLKGVEAEAVELMRAAADREGMKIGAWVSMRLREAANRALAAEEEAGFPDAESCPHLSQSVDMALGASALPHLLERVSELEAELRELARTQRAIMTRLLVQS